jgi:hypothetical protein
MSPVHIGFDLGTTTVERRPDVEGAWLMLGRFRMMRNGAANAKSIAAPSELDMTTCLDLGDFVPVHAQAAGAGCALFSLWEDPSDADRPSALFASIASAGANEPSAFLAISSVAHNTTGMA